MRAQREGGHVGGRARGGPLLGAGGADGALAARAAAGPPHLQRGEHGLGRTPALLQPAALAVRIVFFLNIFYCPTNILVVRLVFFNLSYYPSNILSVRLVFFFNLS